MRPNRSPRLFRLFPLLLLLPPALPAAHAGLGGLADLQPVVLRGSDLPALTGVPVGEIWAYRYDAAASGFVQVPVQVDERAPYELSRGQTDPVYELTYDWFGVDDGLLDADDEVAFMARDAGDRAPDTFAWVAGAGDTRYEVRIDDPLSGATGWVYLFVSSTLTDVDPAFSYVTYTAPDPITGVAEVDGPTYRIGYDGRWRLTRLEVKPGPDLLDRIKTRAYAVVGSETEETFENTSEMLGTRAGKVRALREVQGAASGPLTTHVDRFYRDLWRRSIHLRVHPMPNIWYYFDYLPPPQPGMFFSSVHPGGVVIDGGNDLPSAGLPTWSQVSLPGGTLVFYLREDTGFPWPDPGRTCAPVAGTSFYWRDDSRFDDLTGEDAAAYGNHGVHTQCTADTNASPYSSTWSHYFLPPQDPYQSIGAPYAAREENPLGVSTEAQARAALTDAGLYMVSRAGGGRLTFDWIDALGEESYEIYRGLLTSPFSYSHDTALACGLPAGTVTWTTPDDQESGQPPYYYLIVPRRGPERRYGYDGAGAPRPGSAAPCP